MTISPKWSAIDGMSKSIGAEIMNPPWDWTEFIMKFEPKVEEDVWATVSI